MSPIHGAAASDEPLQLSLLQGFPVSAAASRPAPPWPPGFRWRRCGWSPPSRTSTGPSTTACRPGSTPRRSPVSA